MFYIKKVFCEQNTNLIVIGNLAMGNINREVLFCAGVCVCVGERVSSLNTEDLLLPQEY